MRRWVAVILVLAGSMPAWAWGAPAHRAVTEVALSGLAPELPAWLREPSAVERAAFQSNQPDRWRGWPATTLKHENDPDHYLDAELLEGFGLALETVPPLRGEYLRQMATAKQAHPERVAAYDAEKDPARVQEWPGFVLHAVAEHYAKLQAALNQVRILERLGDPARAEQIAQARAIAIYHLGDLSHFVADIAQPLHTTQHFNGWVGENPRGYRWRDRFHAYVDEGLVTRHGLGSAAALKPYVRYDRRVNTADPWVDVREYFRRSHAQLELLYTLERDGGLDGPEGAALIRGQLADACEMLAALIRAAWESSAPTDEQVEKWLRYDGR